MVQEKVWAAPVREIVAHRRYLPEVPATDGHVAIRKDTRPVLTDRFRL
jgi:hypothetical protein